MPTDARIACASAALMIALGAWLLPGRQAFGAGLLAAVMSTIALTDWREFRIPDVLSLPSVPAGLAATYLLYRCYPGLSWNFALAAAVATTGLWAVRAGYRHYRGREGLGLGDVKLAAVAGAWTGSISLVLLLASLSALAVVGIITLASRQQFSATALIPFGVFLAPAIWAVFVMQAWGTAACQ